ncbi:hypothetical protein IWQ49_006468 [Labrenzia sp. EL_126]|nr:hypothetical protein [Labrenzia sp. EL_126]
MLTGEELFLNAVQEIVLGTDYSVKILELADKNEKVQFLSEKHTGLNGRLLFNPAGTMGLVIDGTCWLYPDEATFLRLHNWSDKPPVPDYEFPGHETRIVRGIYKIPVESFDFIDTAIMPRNCQLRESPHGSVYLFKDNMKHGIPSVEAFEKYQFHWSKVDRRRMLEGEFDNYVDGPFLT